MNILKNYNSRFVINGINYELNSNDYVMTLNEEGNESPYSHEKNKNCVAAIMPMDLNENENNVWILGDIFLSKYYSIFDRDNSRIGFAIAK